MTSLSSIWGNALGTYVLWIPAGLGSATLTKAVLKLGADPNADNGQALIAAITGAGTKRGAKAVQALLEAGADVHKTRPTPLWWAKLGTQNPEIIVLLEAAMKRQPQSPSQGPDAPRHG